MTSAGIRVDAATEQLQDVERRLVGPVQVLQDDDRRARASARVSATATSLADAPRSVSSASSPPDVGGDVEERAERPRREQRLARPGQQRDRVLPLAEAADDRGLAHARFAGEQHQLPRPASTYLGEPGVERREMVVPLEELHPSTLPRRAWAARRVRCGYSTVLSVPDPLEPPDASLSGHGPRSGLCCCWSGCCCSCWTGVVAGRSC